jgi:putative membrane protein insertion efficiency factor
VKTLSPLKYVLIWLLKGYRFAISPLYGQVCRYHPTCSAYALQAVETHGAIRGTYLAAGRVLRCHPWSAGGYDPVPQPHQRDSKQHDLKQHRGEQCSAS